ncbi:hypothetical protein [Streptomyces sp. AK04-3B]|uniref:hypothetical protein n=1 Tax=unclassified Streptomyces TaxID=2593676 RepID=UPI0029C01964|nr:hypothetical protein [Streptomyces sp. AK04-3B]
MTALLEDATAASSMHNAQPWKFRFLHGAGTLHVHSDLDRAMPRADPGNRGLHLGCAAALHRAPWCPGARGTKVASRLDARGLRHGVVGAHSDGRCGHRLHGLGRPMAWAGHRSGLVRPWR